MNVTYNPATGRYEPDYDAATSEYLARTSAAEEAIIAELAAGYGMSPEAFRRHVDRVVAKAVRAVAAAARADGRLPLDGMTETGP